MHIKKFIQVLMITLSSLLFACASVPSGEPGVRAEELTDKMLSAAGYNQWQQTAAVSFTFRNGDRVFWDKSRNFIEVSWEEITVQFKKSNFSAVVTKKGAAVAADEKGELVQEAWGKFINHTFWLSPMFHVRSPGSSREYLKGSLVLKFASGGVTPGDTYLFVPDEQYRIDEMKMWVQVIPVKGATAKFSNYVVTETGVPVATDHEMSLFNVTIRDLKMYKTYPPAGGQDRFADLISASL